MVWFTQVSHPRVAPREGVVGAQALGVRLLFMMQYNVVFIVIYVELLYIIVLFLLGCTERLRKLSLITPPYIKRI